MKLPLLSVLASIKGVNGVSAQRAYGACVKKTASTAAIVIIASKGHSHGQS